MTNARVHRPISISDSLLLAHCAARAEVAVARVAATQRLRLEEWRVLDHLARCSGAAMSELAASVLLTNPTLTRTVDQLVSVGLVYRTPSPVDRRKTVVRLTRRGKATHAAMAELVSAAEQQVIAGVLGEQAAEELRRLLARLLEPDHPLT